MIQRNILEPGLPLSIAIRELPRHLTLGSVTTGIVAAVFGCTGPALILINSALQGHLTPQQLTSWMFGVYFFGGLISLILSLHYQMPLAGAFSIAGTVMLGTTLSQVSFKAAIGAYLICGILMFILGLSGFMGKVMKLLPQPIVMGMIAGTLVRFGTGIITATHQTPLLGGTTLAGYFITQRFFKRVPPIFGGLVTGVGLFLLIGNFDFKFSSSFIWPTVFVPSFEVSTIFSISLPLMVLILGTENAQAIGVSNAQGYKAPVNMITSISGLGGIVASFFGAHAAHMAGVMTAICAGPESGPKEGRYAATVVNGICFMLFGIFSSLAAAFISALPTNLISVVAGLSMLGVLTGAFDQAFRSGKFRSGALFSLLIAMSGLTLLGISASFWALLGGILVSGFIETKDFASN